MCGRQPQPRVGGVGYPGTGLAWQGCPNLRGHSPGAGRSLMSLLGDAHCPGAGCCASETGGAASGAEAMAEQGWEALSEGPPGHPTPKRELVSVPGWGLAPPSCCLGQAQMGQEQCLGWRMLGWVATGPLPTHVWCPSFPILRSPSSAAENDFNYLSGKTTIRENNSFSPPCLCLPAPG